MSDMNNPADDNNGAMDDLWAEALSEQKSTSSKSAADAVFQQFGGGDVSGTLQDIDLIMDIPVKLTVELGRTRMTIKELLRLTQGSVVALDGLAGKVDYAQFLHDGSEVKFTEGKVEHFSAEAIANEDQLILELPPVKPNSLVPVIELFLK